MKQVQLSQSLLPRDIPDPWPSFTGQVVQCFSCTVSPRTGHSTSDMESLELSREAGSAPLTGRAPCSWCTPTIPHNTIDSPGQKGTAVTLSTCHPPRFQGPSQQRCSLVGHPLTHTCDWVLFFHVCLYRTHYYELCLWGKNRKKEKEERMSFLTHFAVSAPSKSTDTFTDTVMEVKAFLVESPVFCNISIFSFCSKANFLLRDNFHHQRHWTIWSKIAHINTS